ncbi:MAG: hypothetical protein D6689_20730 [Deltaproteobacteria bacterium]|nr:MAG: hypothetical protein D6689_20730 [Deltaproteobacteria bacterium]
MRLVDDYCINLRQYAEEVDAPEREAVARTTDEVISELLRRGVGDSAEAWRQIDTFLRRRDEQLLSDHFAAENQLFNELVNGLVNEAGIPAADVISIVEPGGADSFESQVSRVCEEWSTEIESPTTGD